MRRAWPGCIQRSKHIYILTLGAKVLRILLVEGLGDRNWYFEGLIRGRRQVIYCGREVVRMDFGNNV